MISVQIRKMLYNILFCMLRCKYLVYVLTFIRLSIKKKKKDYFLSSLNICSALLFTAGNVFKHFILPREWIYSDWPHYTPSYLIILLVTTLLLATSLSYKWPHYTPSNHFISLVSSYLNIFPEVTTLNP